MKQVGENKKKKKTNVCRATSLTHLEKITLCWCYIKDKRHNQRDMYVNMWNSLETNYTPQKFIQKILCVSLFFLCECAFMWNNERMKVVFSWRLNYYYDVCFNFTYTLLFLSISGENTLYNHRDTCWLFQEMKEKVLKK